MSAFGVRQTGVPGDWRAAARVMPPEPPRSVPQWFFIRRMQSLVFCALFFVAFGLPLLVVMWVLTETYAPLSPWADLALSRNVARAEGRVLSKELVRSVHMNSQHPWRVVFRFQTAEGQKFDAVGFTYDSAFETKQPGDRLEVEYHAARPALARPAGGYVAAGPPGLGLVLYGVLGGLPLLGLVFGAVVLGRAARERRLLTYGIGTAGEVQAVRPVCHINFGRKHPYDVLYRFHDHAGQPITGKDRTYHYAWAESLRPGDPVGVIYHPFRTTENVLWLPGGVAQPWRAAAAPDYR